MNIKKATQSSINNSFGNKRLAEQTFRFIGEKQPVVKSKAPLPNADFLKNWAKE